VYDEDEEGNLKKLSFVNRDIIAWNFDGSNISSNMDDLKMLRFECGDIIKNYDRFFVP
jgi:hypothetical protein